MLNLFQFVDAWFMIGAVALLVLIFVAVFVWNSPRRREIAAPRRSVTSRH
jgi:hypothetical protein